VRNTTPVFQFTVYPHHRNILLQRIPDKGSGVADKKFTSTILPHHVAAIRKIETVAFFSEIKPRAGDSDFVAPHAPP
jgi:hypothetical protein